MDPHPLDTPLFDYELYRFGRRRQIFRGPQPDLRTGYLCFLGATHTFGRYAEAPFPALAGTALDVRVLNLGAEGAGPGFFLSDPEVLRAASGSTVCVIQAMCATAISNRMFIVRPRRNIRLQAVSDTLRGIYPEVDFDRFSYVYPMLRHLMAIDAARFRLVENEMKCAWISRTQMLLNALQAPTILLWFARRAPDRDSSSETGDSTAYPFFVDRAMIDTVRPAANGYVEIVTERGLPQDLCVDGQPVLFRPNGIPIDQNRDFPSPEMHADVADALIPEIRRLMSSCHL